MNSYSNNTNNTTSHSCNKLSSCDKYDPKYLYTNNGELISLVEKDFQEIVEEIKLIYHNNIEMMEYDKNDPDLIQAVKENKLIIDQKLFLLENIRFKLKKLSKCHPFVELNIMEYITKEKSDKQQVVESIDEEEEEMSNVQIMNQIDL